MISPSPRTVKQALAGQSFHVKDVAGTLVEFAFPESFGTWPRRGMEGIVVPVICQHPTRGPIPSILKCFDHYLPERSPRQEYLVRLGLASLHEWLYEGVPYLWMHREVCGVPVYGHVAKRVGSAVAGEDFRIVRDSEQIDAFSEDNRLEMAAQLCVAVSGLERIDIVHGDLSPANIIVARDGDHARCSVIDYDGYRSSAVSDLPRLHEDVAVRPLGSPGYQHPSLMHRLAADKDNSDETLRVENDRFALAVLCVELMTWTATTGEALDRTELLDTEALLRHRLVVPPSVAARWPEGVALLERCVQEPDPAALPSPEEWLALLGFLDGDERGGGWSALPIMELNRASGNQPARLVSRVTFQNEGAVSGNLELLDPALRVVDYDYEIVDGRCRELRLRFRWTYPVWRQRDGRTRRVADADAPIDIRPGDKLLSNGWSFVFPPSENGA